MAEGLRVGFNVRGRKGVILGLGTGVGSLVGIAEGDCVGGGTAFFQRIIMRSAAWSWVSVTAFSFSPVHVIISIPLASICLGRRRRWRRGGCACWGGRT